MCFGNRILSPFHLKILKTHSRTWFLSPLYDLKLGHRLESPGSSLPRSTCRPPFRNSIMRKFVSFFSKLQHHCSAICCSVLWFYHVYRRAFHFYRISFQINHKDHIAPASLHKAGIKIMSGHAFLAFLGQWRFWMDIVWLARWNRLEILIPKHM